jgi:hypothetical protein
MRIPLTHTMLRVGGNSGLATPEEAPLDYDNLVNLMIKYCLKPNPKATKWRKSNDSLLKIRPDIGDLDQSFVGRAWREAKEKFNLTNKPLGDQTSPLTKPLEVVEVVPEGLTGALSTTNKPLPGSGQGLTPPGSPVQVNINVTTDQQKETNKPLSPPKNDARMTDRELAEQARRLKAVAKKANEVCNTMIQKNVTYSGLLPAVEMVVGKEGKALVEQVAALIIDYRGLTCLLHSSK